MHEKAFGVRSVMLLNIGREHNFRVKCLKKHHASADELPKLRNRGYRKMLGLYTRVKNTERAGCLHGENRI